MNYFPTLRTLKMAQLLKEFCELHGKFFESPNLHSVSANDLDGAEALLRLSYTIDKQINKEGAELRWNSFSILG